MGGNRGAVVTSVDDAKHVPVTAGSIIVKINDALCRKMRHEEIFKLLTEIKFPKAIKFELHHEFGVGEDVEARTTKGWSHVLIVKANPDGTYDVKFESGKTAKWKYSNMRRKKKYRCLGYNDKGVGYRSDLTTEKRVSRRMD